jgi:hypothetical protein
VIPAGTYGLAETAARAWTAHVVHHLGCWPPVVLAALGGPGPWARALARATRQHRDDWAAALRSVRDAALHGAPARG